MQTVWILGDQLSPEHAALAATNPRESRVLMVESKARGSALRYHKLKLVLVYSAMRHFAQDLRNAGWEVDYQLIEGTGTFEDGVRRHLEQRRPEKLVLAEPNSFPETDAVSKLGRKLRTPVEFVPTAQFLQSRDDFRAWASGQKRLLMENHYRRMRKRFGWLMEEDGQPAGGAWNFDPENRATYTTWKRAGAPRASTPLLEKPDQLTREVIATLAREFPENPGRAEAFWLPVDRAGALRWLRYFIDERLPSFGVYEDMMAEGEPYLFHSVLSPLINLGLLTPRECVEAAIEAYRRGTAPLNSAEGYVRQMIGWREFINGVYWLRGPEYKKLNSLGATRPLSAWFYTSETPMNCLHHVLKQNLELGWNHHIQRLMVLGNFFLISGISPQEALRWYNEMYVDAYDWVMAANVIGMSLYADGGYMATKPYADTSNYIRKMSNYCKGCRFDPDQKTGTDACPFNYLYWRFIDEHAEQFGRNPRMRTITKAWLARPEPSKEEVRISARAFLETAVPA
ncbi:MAG: cryptochrome/photolyase family protein [Chthoniobacterales bacterium]|nr:cryptochrome/photolyase family protein [Chthoniobacterales bacterium]